MRVMQPGAAMQPEAGLTRGSRNGSNIMRVSHNQRVTLAGNGYRSVLRAAALGSSKLSRHRAFLSGRKESSVCRGRRLGVRVRAEDSNGTSAESSGETHDTSSTVSSTFLSSNTPSSRVPFPASNYLTRLEITYMVWFHLFQLTSSTDSVTCSQKRYPLWS